MSQRLNDLRAALSASNTVWRNRVLAWAAYEEGARMQLDTRTDARLDALEARVTKLEGGTVPPPPPPDPDPDPDPEPPPPTPTGDGPLFGWLPAPGTSSVGLRPPGPREAGNSPIRSAQAFDAMRIVPSRPGQGLKITKVEFNGKDDVANGYAAGNPRWSVELVSCNPADGMFGTVLHRSEHDALQLIDGGNCVVTIPTPVAFDQPLWLRVKNISSNPGSNWASVNYMRYTPFSGQPHLANDWNKKGKSFMGLDYRSVVYHYGYGGSPVWGYYGGESLAVMPTYAVYLSDGSVEGAPFYGGWGQTKGPNTFTALKDGSFSQIYGAGSGTVNVTHNGTQVASVAISGNPKAYSLGKTVTVKKGDKVVITRNGGTFTGMAMDSVRYGRLKNVYQVGTTGDGVIPVGPLA